LQSEGAAFGLSLAKDGNVIVELKSPYSDGTTHVVLSPKEFIGRLVALVPKPRKNLTRYHGVFSPNSQLRKKIVPKQAIQGEAEHSAKCQFGSKRYGMHWAQRLKRVFNIDITTCDQCGGKVKVIACIEAPKAIEKILKHLGLYEATRPRNRSPPADHHDLFDQVSPLI
jgi:hypothetical protein